MSNSAHTPQERIDLVEQSKVKALLEAPMLPEFESGDAGKVPTVKEDLSGFEYKEASGGTTEPLIVVLDAETGYTNKTYKECKDAFLAGQMVLYRYLYEYEEQVQQDSYFTITSLDEQSGMYSVFFGIYTFTTDDPTHTMYMPD